MKWFDAISEQYVQNATIGYMQDSPLEVFNVFPKLNVAYMKGLIAKYAKADWFRIGDVNQYKRTGSTESVGDTFASDSQSFLLEQYSFHKDLTQDDIREIPNPYAAVNDAVRFIVNRMNRVMLKTLVNEFMSADGTWGNEATSPSKWTATDTDPVDQVLGWQQTIEQTTGFKPNKMIITPDCYKALKLNSQVTDRMAYTQTQIPSTSLLASMFDLDQLIVLNAVNESADGYMASGKALLCYTPSSAGASKFEPSAGYIMTYQGEDSFNVGTRRIPMPERNDSLRIESDMWVDPVVPAPDCGYLVTNLV